MTIPANPTLVSITTEALNMAGYANPTAVQLTRAALWIEEIKNDIWNKALINGDTRLKTLQTSNIQISVDNQSAYAMPSDFDEEILVELLDGAHTGTAQSGAATSITLASDEDITEAEILGSGILITGDTGKGGFRQAISYNTTSKVVGINSAWATNPDSTSEYLIVNKYYKLGERNITEMTEDRVSPGRPYYFHKVNDGETTNIYFERPCDKATYGIRVRYYANMQHVDLDTSTSAVIGLIYKNWKSVLTQGVLYKVLKDFNDQRYLVERDIF